MGGVDTHVHSTALAAESTCASPALTAGSVSLHCCRKCALEPHSLGLQRTPAADVVGWSRRGAQESRELVAQKAKDAHSAALAAKIAKCAPLPRCPLHMATTRHSLRPTGRRCCSLVSDTLEPVPEQLQGGGFENLRHVGVRLQVQEQERSAFKCPRDAGLEVFYPTFLLLKWQ